MLGISIVSRILCPLPGTGVIWISYSRTGSDGELAYATGFGDQDAADVFTEISRAVDKSLWFVEAHSVNK